MRVAVSTATTVSLNSDTAANSATPSSTKTTSPAAITPSTLSKSRRAVLDKLAAVGGKQLPHRIITTPTDQSTSNTFSISTAVAAITSALEPPTMPSRRTVSASPSRPLMKPVPLSAPTRPSEFSRFFLAPYNDGFTNQSELSEDGEVDAYASNASARDAEIDATLVRLWVPNAAGRQRQPSVRRSNTAFDDTGILLRDTEYYQPNGCAVNGNGNNGSSYYASALVDELSLSPAATHGTSQRATSPVQYVYKAPCERHPAENQPNYVVNDKFQSVQNDVSRIAFGVRVSDFLPVAFKTVRDPALANTELAILRHLGQCRRTATCPHICHLLNTFVDDEGLPVLVVKMLQKLTWIDLDLIDIANKARELMLALKAIHSVGVAHLDVNPANLMMDAKNRLVLIDFGLARECVPETGNTRRSSAMTDPTSTTGMGICCDYCNRQSPSESLSDLSTGPVKRMLRSGAGEQSSDNLLCLARESREADIVPPSTRVGRNWRGRERSPFQKPIAASVMSMVYSTSCPVPSFLDTPGLSERSPDSKHTHHTHYLLPHPTRGTPGFIAPELYASSAIPTDSMDDTATYLSYERSSTSYSLPTGAPDLYSAGVVIGIALAPFIPDCDLHFLGGSMIRKDTTNQIVAKLEEFVRNPFTKQRCPPIVIMAAEMLRGLLDEDPRRRMTANEALRSPFFMALEEGGGGWGGGSSVSETPVTPTGPVVFSSRVARFFEGTDRKSYDARLREWEWARYQSERSSTTYGSYGNYDDYGDANESLRCR